MGTGLFINLHEINRGDFRISERLHDIAGKVILITPDSDKHLWDRDELHLRSLLLSEDGEILCSGFPKFRNYGEDNLDDIITRRLIAEGRAFFTEKMDGSLIIRTVIDGVVCFRTRGSHNLGDFADPVLNLIRERYEALLNPDLASDMTLLFEYTSPDNQIIVEYDDSQLTILGAMLYDHASGLPIFSGNKGLIDNLAGMFGVSPVKFYTLPNDLDQIAKAVRGWLDSEGIVVWCMLEDGRMHLAKIKAEEYVRLHSLKFHLSGKKIKRLCWMRNIETEAQLKTHMFELGVDWEFVSFVMDDFNEYVSRLNYMRNRVEEIKARIHAEKIHELPTIKRKVIHLKRIYSDKKDFQIGIQYCRGNLDYLERVSEAYALEIPMNSLKILRENLAEEYQRYGF